MGKIIKDKKPPGLTFELFEKLQCEAMANVISRENLKILEMLEDKFKPEPRLVWANHVTFKD